MTSLVRLSWRLNDPLSILLNLEYNTRAAKVVASTMWSLANAPGEPTNLEVNTTATENSSQFR